MNINDLPYDHPICKIRRWYNSRYRPWGGWRRYFEIKWLYWSRHLYHSVYISSSKGLDVAWAGTKDLPYRTLAYTANAIKDYKGKLRFRLKGGDVFYEDFPIISKTPKYLWVEPYGKGRPTIYTGKGMTVNRDNSFMLNLNFYHEVNYSCPTLYNHITAPMSNFTISEELFFTMPTSSTAKKSPTEGPGKSEKESEPS